MKSYNRYEAEVLTEGGTLINFGAKTYNELVYSVSGYLDSSEENQFFFNMSAFTSEEEKIVLCNIEEGIGPICKKSLMNIMISFKMYSEPVNNIIFDGSISKCGNSYVIKVTEQCRMMELDIGDMVRVKMERINTVESRDGIQRLFYRKDVHSIDIDGIYVNEFEYFNKFLKDYRIVGMVSLRGIKFDYMMDLVIDHEFAVRNEDGTVILVSQPYNAEGKEEYARAFADAHGLDYDYINEYSWYHRGKTKVILFWLKGTELKKVV